MSKLILIRHGQSIWNAANKFTGWVDVPLSRRGRAEAMIAASKLQEKGCRIDVCFTSVLIRAMETAIICLTEYDEICAGKTPIFKHEVDDADWHGWDKYDGDAKAELPIFPTPALDERYYGDLQGLNKAQTAEKYGADRVHEWRRSYSTRPPGGESLEDTQKRVTEYFEKRIFAHIAHEDNVLVAAHGNSLRSMIMRIESLSPEEVPNVELDTGVPLVYEVDEQAKVVNKIVLK